MRVWPTALAALDVAAERRGAAGLDRRHDLELGQAHVAGVGRPPGRAVQAEDVGDLQRGRMPGSGAGAVTLHEQLEVLERARHGPDRLGGDAGVERGGVELGVAEQDLDDADVDVLLQQMGGEAVAQRVRASRAC